MRKTALKKSVIALCIIFLMLNAIAAESENTIYDSDPNHLWNHLNETLFLRTAQDGKKYGLDELDILYWRNTKNLLMEPSHQQALAILDEFLQTHGEKLIREPLKRALLQRDLWELFDWSASPWPNEKYQKERGELQQRLAIAIHRVALTTNEISQLPDNYTQSERMDLPDLPHGLFETNGVWVNVGVGGEQSAAPTHMSHFAGHSTFSVMLHLPEGRKAALDYLEKLRAFAQLEHVLVYETNRFPFSTNSPREILQLNSNVPQFPTNTEWVLVRRMCVVDAEGRLQPTRIVESVQVRRYLEIAPKRRASSISDPQQVFFEFQLERKKNGYLRTVTPDERDFNFVHFMGKGIDALEYTRRNSDPSRDSRDSQGVVLKTCLDCHSAPGIFSVNSYTRSLSPEPRPASLIALGIDQEFTGTKVWKLQRFDWGLLQGLWAERN